MRRCIRFIPSLRSVIGFLLFCSVVIALCGQSAVFAEALVKTTLQIPILGQQSITVCRNERCTGIAFYVALAYKWLVGFATVLAVIVIAYGGVRWLTAGGESGKVEEAKKVIGNALMGLLIALFSYVGLATINQQFVFFKPLKITPTKPITLSLKDIDSGRITDPSSPDYKKQFTVVPNLKDLNPDIKYSPTAQDVLSRVKGHKYYTAGWTGSIETGAITGFGSYRDNLQSLVHENAHGLNSADGIMPSCDGQTIYLLNGKSDCLADSSLASKDGRQFIPEIFKSLDNAKYALRFFGIEGEGRPEDGDRPILVVFDEQDANTIELKVATDLVKSGHADKAQYLHPVQLIPYTLAAALAIEKNDRGYLRDHPGIKKTVRRLIEDVLATDREFQRHAPPKRTDLDGSDKESGYYVTRETLRALRNDRDPKTEALRDLANRWNIHF